jgi:hypothetical protein
VRDASEPQEGAQTGGPAEVLAAGTHFGHREADGIVVDLFWNRGELEDEFRVEVEDRRDGTRFVLHPTTGREALQGFHHNPVLDRRGVTCRGCPLLSMILSMLLPRSQT